MPSFSGGDGTSGNPFHVANVDDLNNIRYFRNANFIQNADITFTFGTLFEPIGEIWEPFTGDFNGNGYIISNLTIFNSENPDVGLFGAIENSILSNITLENISITANSEFNFRIGGLVGSMESSNISKSSATGDITLYSNNCPYTQVQLGGLVGSNNMYFYGRFQGRNLL